MIPNESTPIKHTILIEIIAQGRLSYDEVRIASFIMRWSWGFDEGERRQDWTKEFTISEIAREIKMNQGLCSNTINRMIKDGKLLRDGNKFQFNEHYENWKVLEKVIPIRKTNSTYEKNSYPLLEKLIPSIRKTNTPDVQETLIAKAPEGENALHKDTLKILKDKEITNTGFPQSDKSFKDKYIDAEQKNADGENSKAQALQEKGGGICENSQPQALQEKAIAEVFDKFSDAMGFKASIGYRVNNRDYVILLLQDHTVDEILKAIEVGKKEYKREEKDYKKFITLKSLPNAIDMWLGLASKEKQEVKGGWY